MSHKKKVEMNKIDKHSDIGSEENYEKFCYSENVNL